MQPVVIAAVVGHERLQRGLEPLQLVKSEEVVHCYSCQFRPVPKKFYIPIDSTKHSRVQFHVQSPASVLKKYIYSSLYIGINVCRLFPQNSLHKFSMTHFSLYPSNTIYPLPFIQSNWPSVPFLRTWMTTTNQASIGWNCMNNVTLKYKIRLLYPLIV